ncbi:alanyl-tRNA editing protein [Sulfitobacter donghicola]|uniref:Alanine--tRNA ligase n=1 Tax=Sulfitobacter donghicola DSW-25 = KCTC 12864 = JCM 14565 TaxID=1300350 RepID=A0A073ICH7_9RHOB|nr:alanyl-tRNA editing protein [Sulfitobacter donghicola]KEJ88003.1 Ala-tRNA(Pro) hydrolase [Sulfitobacter donghicola DSW-25 = KCTC 12864 = JCM 14565]KIN69515.1 Alanyl-transfer RNA synthetase domain protein [Sulfitobacter donghicola DSW-25 = KCTC 12864 = JCM 14565]
MTRKLFREDPYQRDAPAVVTAHTAEGGIILDATVFYPTGGGQPGDSGWIEWDSHRLSIATAVNGDANQIVLVPSEPMALPPLGAHVVQHLDWDRRHKHMRIHTALHLLSVAVPFAVTGGAISATHGRLDFNMPDGLDDRNELEEALNQFVESDAQVSDGWITEEELDAAPSLVKTMAVKPPRGAGDIRLVRIGGENDWIDLQPCGGTHVARTGEIGALRIGKIEKKGRMNRRIYLHLDS